MRGTRHGTQAGEPTRVKLREHLVGFVAAGDRRLAVELLALLGPDLDTEGEDLLRRVAGDDPYRLAPALESGLTGLGLCTYRPELLVELVEAYYLDDDTNAEDGFGGGLHDNGIRDHQFGRGTPLAAYYRGPFIWMFRSSFRKSIACLNRLLNHAARFRVAEIQSPGWGQPGGRDPDLYRTELSITGSPRSYIGDGHAWLWYRGTGVGPYPCMSALQALELVCDEFIEAGAPLARLVSILLDDCENLAMPGLVVGLLVRHLEKAGEALDPYLAEPAIWHLEFNRMVNESSGIAANAASVKSPERRKWSIAAFIPSPTYDYGHLYRELDSDPIVWTDVEAWQPQVVRWLPMAAGQREGLDSLVHLLHSVPDDQQGRLGLTWVETLVQPDPSEVAWKSYLLPKWLHDTRPHLHEPDLTDCWQRIVDMLIVAGDTRVADLAD